jgi:hypothetical protein
MKLYKDILNVILLLLLSSLIVNKIKQRDEMKRSVMESNGHTLIIVPCWWDGNTERLAFIFLFSSLLHSNLYSSLVATLRKKRPDLCPQYNEKVMIPILDDPPKDFFKGMITFNVAYVLLIVRN